MVVKARLGFKNLSAKFALPFTTLLALFLG
jgi:hypothetical protein